MDQKIQKKSRKTKEGNPYLTRKKALDIIKKELWLRVSAKDIADGEEGYFFSIRIGNKFRIWVDNDFYHGSGCFRLEISTNYGPEGRIEKYYDPETLEESFEVAEEIRLKTKKEAIEDHIFEIGLEGCKAILAQRGEH